MQLLWWAIRRIRLEIIHFKSLGNLIFFHLVFFFCFLPTRFLKTWCNNFNCLNELGSFCILFTQFLFFVCVLKLSLLEIITYFLCMTGLLVMYIFLLKRMLNEKTIFKSVILTNSLFSIHAPWSSVKALTNSRFFSPTSTIDLSCNLSLRSTRKGFYCFD